MPTVPIHNAGNLGVIKDVAPHELAPEAFSDARNVRFQNGKVIEFTGESSVFEDASFVVPYYFLRAVHGDASLFWLLMGLAKIYTTTGGTHTNITRQSAGVDVDYTGDADDKWCTTILGGIPVLTNGVDLPQYWPSISAGTKLANFPTTAGLWNTNHRAKIIRAFKSYLMAFNITKTSTKYPNLVKWSHPADPGALPSSWDETDATKDAGEKPLDSGGQILDALPLGDTMIIYSETTTHGARLTNNQQIFTFPLILSESGILAQDCVKAVPALKKHFVVTGDDILLFNGVDGESIADRRVRNHIFRQLDATYFSRSFVSIDYFQREMWFCYPETGNSFPNIAAVWSWVENNWTFRDLNQISHIANGPIDDSDFDETWDGDSDTWDDDTSVWNELFFRASIRDMLMAQPGSTKLLRGDYSNLFDGTTIHSWVERTGLALIGRDRFGNPKVDMQARKFVDEIWPRISGGAVQVTVGASDMAANTPTYGNPVTFDPATDDKADADPPMEGRFIAIKIEQESEEDWTMEGYDVNIEPTGRY